MNQINESINTTNTHDIERNRITKGMRIFKDKIDLDSGIPGVFCDGEEGHFDAWVCNLDQYIHISGVQNPGSRFQLYVDGAEILQDYLANRNKEPEETAHRHDCKGETRFGCEGCANAKVDELLSRPVWICGKYMNDTWEIQGVFLDEELAKAQCTTSMHFIGPVKLNESLPEKSEMWPGCYYPNDLEVE